MTKPDLDSVHLEAAAVQPRCRDRTCRGGSDERRQCEAVQPHREPACASHGPATPSQLTVEMPNGVTHGLECTGQVAGLARRTGVNAILLRRWLKKYQQQYGGATSGVFGNPPPPAMRNVPT